MGELRAGLKALEGFEALTSPAESTQPAAGAAATPRERAERVRRVVDAHFDFVWRLLRRLGVSESDADDATQQVFVVAAQRMDTILEGSERTFLFGTALRTAATLRRNSKRRERWVETRPADTACPEATPDEALERRQALALLDHLLEELPDDLRVVFVLCELEELTAPEIAALQNIPVGTVASRLRRARKEFSERLRRFQAQRGRQP
jgi:RNA polymerase sigma-70 factor (ECF subfamily)